MVSYHANMVRKPSTLILLITLGLGWQSLMSEGNQSSTPLSTDSATRAEPSAKEESPFTPVGGGVEVDLEKKIIRVPIELVGKGNEKDPNRSLGLEFLVTIGKDKDYESMFSTDASGQNLHMALLMIGREPAQKATTIPASANLHIEISMNEGRMPAKDWLLWSDQSPVKDLSWFFKGSEVHKFGNRREYAADQALNFIASLPSNAMVVGPGVEVGNPYNEEDKYLIPMVLPAIDIGTKGWMWIQAR